MDFEIRMAPAITRNVLIVCVLLFGVVSCYGSPTLLFATHKDIRMANVSRNNKINIIVKDLSEGAAVDFYYERELVCWSDSGLEMIQCIHFNGTHTGEHMTVVNSSLISPDGLVCDWYTNKLYWTDGEKNRIEVTSIDGRYRKVLFWTDIYQPRAIALAPMKRLLFWTDWGDVPKIERASMDGDPNTREVIVSDNIFWPNGITVDYENELIYWADGKLLFIAVMDYHGNNRRTIINHNLDYPFAITYFDNRLYWTDWKTWCIHSYDMRQTQTHPRELFHGEFIPGDIEVWDARRQPYGDNPCRQNNGNCSHLCLLSTSERGYTCACPTGIKLIDNFTCAKRPEELLFIVQRTEISRISLDSPDYTNFVLPLTGIKHAIAIDFDPVDEMLYWTDEQASVIRRAYLDGSGQEDLIVSEVTNPDGLAIDWVARNMYWTDTGTDRIEVARLNGINRKVLLNDDLYEPRAIAVAPDLGWMFWTDWNEKRPKIERSNLDGSERTLLINKDIVWPNGIALDLERMKMYWCDAKTDKIEVSNMDGSDRREVITDNLPHLFGLSLLDDYLYWTDWQRRSIDRAHKLTGGDREVIIDQVPNVMGLKVVHLGLVNVSTNPCSRDNGGCSHLCFNRPNNKHVCACQIGYELTKDKRTCVVPDAFLLFARKENIGRISIENANNDNIIPITGVKDASALDFDISENRIYWTDVKLKTITRAFINGSEMERVVDLGLETPEGLALDWIAHNLYWSDTNTRRIEMIRLKGSIRRVLVWQNLIEPRGLALDPEKGHMYWAEWGGVGSINRANLDGTQRQTITSTVGRANGLTIDHAARKLYWANLHNPAIDCFDLQTKRKDAIITQDIVYPFSITQYRDYIYWTDWNTGDIERADKLTGANRTKIYDQLESVTDLLVFHASRQTGWNPCALANGNCSHLCIALPGVNGSTSTSRKCACPTHYSLARDNRTCVSPKRFMIYSLRNSITRYLPDLPGDCADVVLRLQGLKNVRAIEFDPVTQYVYWIDGRTYAIRRALENRTQHVNTVVVYGGSGHPFDLALDPLGRLLFWTCATNDVINVTRIDNGSTLGIVVKGEGEKPRNIALHPQQRLLFWTDVGKMRVMQSKIDGKERVIIASDVEQPVSLAVDIVANVVYWSHGKVIECSDFNGGNRRIVVSVETANSVLHMSVLGHYFYWFERDTTTLKRVNKTSGGDRRELMARTLTDLVTVNTPDDMKTHVCSPFNDYGGCSHFCTGTISPRCSCPRSLVLSDNGRNCRAAPACGSDHFTCAAPNSAVAKDCIPATWKCDGQTDCQDGSDELGCPVCGRDQFKCQNLCIDMSRVCDGTADCNDESDEAHCCRPGQFQCAGNGVCIPAIALCDSWEDCADGSDELPPACETARQRQETGPAPESSKVTYVIVALVVVVAICMTMLSYYYCRKRFIGNEGLPDILHDSAGDPLSPKPNRVAKPMFTQKNNRKDIKVDIEAMRMSMLNGSSLGSSYDRSHITGASSSTRGSSAGGYPQETLNPPPSPATIASSTRCSSSNASRYKPYRHYRSINQPPPPTPCSTDVCDESDSNYPARYRYESEPFPPPPTPRSVYHSDAAISCPPSPSSRSSTYFSPLPPPPSPVP